MVVLVDNAVESINDDLVLSDDGSGADIMIPTVMISKDDGHKMIDYLANNVNASIILS